MNWPFGLRVLFGAWLLAFASSAPAKAAEIKVLSSLGFREVLQDLAPEFERATGHKPLLKFDSSVGVKRAIDAGTEFDIAIAAPGEIEGLIRAGKIRKETEITLARVVIGVSIRAGAPKPDISSTEAFKQAMLQARSIMHNKEGASGRYVAALFERLGLTEQLKDKITVKQVAGPVAEDVARGEAEIGFQLISEILPVPGAELLGPLPPELQTYVVLKAGIGSTAKAEGPAGELIEFLALPASAEVMKARGMEPVSR